MKWRHTYADVSKNAEIIARARVWDAHVSIPSGDKRNCCCIFSIHIQSDLFTKAEKSRGEAKISLSVCPWPTAKENNEV